MSILLTAEEIRAIPGSSFGGCEDDLNVAKAQLKKVVESISRECEFITYRDEIDCIIVNDEFWNTLKKEAGIE